MDENFQTYLNRVMRLTLPDTYVAQMQHIQESAKFQPHPEGYQPTPFPGFSIITPPAKDDTGNPSLYADLVGQQQQLLHSLGEKLFVAVPPESLHLTVADLIWDSSYRLVAEGNPDFDRQLQSRIAEIFQQVDAQGERLAVSLQVLGLMVMPRAIGVCLAPTDEGSYNRLVQFRRAVYQDRDLMALGIEPQYYFTLHITLGYFGNVPPAEQLTALDDRLLELNQHWLEAEPQTLSVHRAELRKFDDMTHFYREPNWATFEF